MLREMTSQHNEMHAPSSSNIDRQVAVEVCVCACVRLVVLYEATSMSQNRQHWLVLVWDGAQRLLRRSWNNTLFRRQKKNTASIVEPLPRLIHAYSLIQNAKTTELRGARALSSKIPPGVQWWNYEPNYEVPIAVPRKKWREKVRFLNESGFYFFTHFDSQISAAYIRKRFRFGKIRYIKISC